MVPRMSVAKIISFVVCKFIARFPVVNVCIGYKVAEDIPQRQNKFLSLNFQSLLTDCCVFARGNWRNKEVYSHCVGAEFFNQNLRSGVILFTLTKFCAV